MVDPPVVRPRFYVHFFVGRLWQSGALSACRRHRVVVALWVGMEKTLYLSLRVDWYHPQAVLCSALGAAGM